MQDIITHYTSVLQHYASTIDCDRRDAFRKQIILDDPLKFSRYISAETRKLLINTITAKINDYIRENGHTYLSPNDIYTEEFKLRLGLFQAIQYKNGKFYITIKNKLIGPIYSSYNTLDSFILLLLYHSHVEIQESLYFNIEYRDWDEIEYDTEWTPFRLSINIPIHYIKQAIKILKTQTDKTSKLLIKKYYEFINVDKTTKKMNMEDDDDVNDADDWDDIDDDLDEDDSFDDIDGFGDLDDEDYEDDGDDDDDLDED